MNKSNQNNNFTLNQLLSVKERKKANKLIDQSGLKKTSDSENDPILQLRKDQNNFQFCNPAHQEISQLLKLY